MCAYAAHGGHLKSLQWARHHDALWDASTITLAAQARAPGGVALCAGAWEPGVVITQARHVLVTTSSGGVIMHEEGLHRIQMATAT